MWFCVLRLLDHSRVHRMLKNSAFAAGQGLAFRGYYTLNQTNDWSIMRTVYTGLFVPVSINWGFSVEPQPNVIVYCTSIVVCFKKRGQCQSLTAHK